MHLICRYWRR